MGQEDEVEAPLGGLDGPDPIDASGGTPSQFPLFTPGSWWRSRRTRPGTAPPASRRATPTATMPAGSAPPEEPFTGQRALALVNSIGGHPTFRGLAATA